MPKLDLTRRIVRQTEVEIEFMNDKGELETVKTPVFYYSPRTSDLREFEDYRKKRYAEDPDAIIWTSEVALRQIESLPELTDEVTLEFLDSIDVNILYTIMQAIKEAQSPKEPAGK